MIKESDIILRPPDETDVDLLYKWENNAEFSQYSSSQKNYSLEEIKSFIRSIKDIRANKQFRLMICLKKSNQVIGTVDLYEIDFEEKSAGVGILIADKYNRRRGFATQALVSATSFAREKLRLNQLFCEITTDNIESQKLFRKAGFGSKTLRKNAYIIDSIPVDVYFYEKNIR